ncbi:MAG: ferritin family protein [bacterium]
MSDGKKTVNSVEEAITTSIAFETRVRNIYQDAMKAASDETGKRVFKLLADEEQGHLDYLQSRLEEWRSTGKITPEKMKTVIPPQEVINGRAKVLSSKLEGDARGQEIEMLKKAEVVEMEVSEFYAQMVEELDAEAQQMFQRFLEIEKGHLAIVRAEIDALSGSGYFFDFAEFDMESGG